MTQQTRNAIWQDYLDLERLVRYYSHLSSKYHRRRRWLQLIVLLATLIGFASLALPSLAWVAPSVVALVVLFERHDRTRERAVTSDLLVSLSRQAHDHWSALWEEANAGIGSDAELLEKKKGLVDRIRQTVGVLDLRLGFGANGDSPLNQRAAEEAYAAAAARYAIP